MIFQRHAALSAANPGLRVLTASLAVSTVGTGMWTSARVIYLARCGLSTAQIATGLLVAGLIAAAVTVPAGSHLDRLASHSSRRQVTMALLAVEGVLAGLFAIVHSFAGFLLLAVLAGAAERVCAATAATLIGELFGADRATCRAAMSAAMNTGLCLGGLLAAVALATGSLAALQVIAVANGVSYLIACGLTSRLPVAPPASATVSSAAAARLQPAGPGSCRQPGRRGQTGQGRPGIGRRYAAYGAANAALTVHAVLLPVLLPLWIARTHDVPAWTIGAALFLNSAAIGVWQLPVSRRIRDTRLAAGAAGRSAVLIMAAFGTVAVLGPLPAAARVAGLALAICVYTAAELEHTASAIHLSYALADDRPLSSRQSYFAATLGVSKAVGPIIAAAAVATGPVGLIVLGGGLLVAGAGVSVSADDRHGVTGLLCTGLRVRRPLPWRNGQSVRAPS